MIKLKVKKVFHSWQFWYAVKEVLGLDFLYRLYGYRNARQIQGWYSNPATNETVIPNPIDKLKIVFEELRFHGREDLAIKGLQLLAEPLGVEIKTPQAYQPAKEPLQEFLDVVQSIGELAKETQQALCDGLLEEEEALSILDLVDQAIKELMQFKNAIRLDMEGCPSQVKGARL